MKTWTIRAKLRMALVTMAVLVCAVALTAGVGLNASHRHFADYVNVTAERMALANEVMHASNARAIAARNMVLTTSPEALAKEKGRAVAAHELVQQSYQALRGHIEHDKDVSAQERQAFDALVAVESQYAQVALRIVNMADKGQREEAIQDMNGNCYPLLDRLVAGMEDYHKLGLKHAHDVVAHADQAATREMGGLMLLAALSVLAAIVMAWRLPGFVLGPIERAIEAARAVAEGDLWQHIRVDRHDEAGQLLQAIDAMTHALTGIVSRVREVSDGIHDGSSQIAQGNQDLSNRTEMQAANLQETSATMSEMATAAHGSAQTAEQASRIADEARDAARRGGAVVDEVVSTMSDISASSRKISEIIGTIDGIAFQTNILALNAAVEAARAGEQGRGFAVVAGEVRSLAQRSAEASREIRQLITSSVERVEAGSRLVGTAGASIHDIVSQVDRVATLMQEINEATSRQTAGFSQVNGAVSALDQATQQNAALVEQSAAASESLRQQADRLRSVVAVFQV